MVSLQIFKGCKQSGERITTAGMVCWEFGEATCSGCMEPFHSMAGPLVLPLHGRGKNGFWSYEVGVKGEAPLGMWLEHAGC